MQYKLTHITTYVASERVSVCHNLAWLTPRETRYQTCRSFELTVSPVESHRSFEADAFGNHVTHFSSNTGYETLETAARSVVNVSKPAYPPAADSLPWDSSGFTRNDRNFATAGVLDALQFAFASPRVTVSKKLAAYGRESFPAGQPILEGVRDLTDRIHTEFEYDPQATTVSTPVDEVFAHRHGVCQDFAHLEIAILRSLGIPARYVSGYIRTYASRGGERLVGADASHAWLSVFCGNTQLGDQGWVDVDPTNNKFLTDEYITVAWGRDYSDVPPLKGVYTGGGQHSLSVSVDVEPVGPGSS